MVWVWVCSWARNRSLEGSEVATSEGESRASGRGGGGAATGVGMEALGPLRRNGLFELREDGCAIVRIG